MLIFFISMFDSVEKAEDPRPVPHFRDPPFPPVQNLFHSSSLLFFRFVRLISKHLYPMPKWASLSS